MPTGTSPWRGSVDKRERRRVRRCPACRPRGARTALALPVEDPTAELRLGG